MTTTMKSFASLLLALRGFHFELKDMIRQGVDLDALNDHFTHSPEPMVFLAAFLDALDEGLDLEDFNGRLDLEELTADEARWNCGVYTEGLLALNEHLYQGLPVACPFDRVLLACYDERRCRTAPRNCAVNRSLACSGDQI